MSDTVDVIVVGAGSAGCVMANRLSADGAHAVCLLEAGPRDTYPWIHIPIGYGKTMFHKVVNWGYYTDPDPNMLDRRIYWPRGRTLGGSSAINGLIYIRGQRSDYDAWADAGNPGWGWDDCLPYFRKLETNDLGAGPTRGIDGPLNATSIKTPHPLVEALIAAAGTLGVPHVRDFNTGEQDGVGYYQLTTRNGRRCSTAVAYLRPAEDRPNLRVETGAHTMAILFEGGRACGVRYRQDGQVRTLRARREVVLCAGALQTPQLLQLSGVGPAALLREFGIPVVRDLPGVGENLQDHLQIRLIYETTQPITTNDQLRTLHGRVGMGLQWLLFRGGPLAVGINQGGLFCRVDPASRTPDTQFHFATLSADMAGGKVHPFSGCTYSVCQLRPTSRGHVRLRSADPFEAPAMQPHYLSTEWDRRMTVAAVRYARQVAATEPLAGLMKREFRPGPDVRTDDEILHFCREYGATIFHPSGTAKMGPRSDPMAVVDERLRVHGVAGLRVVDCSIMPTLVSGNTNVPVVMLAERAADFMLEDFKQAQRHPAPPKETAMPKQNEAAVRKVVTASLIGATIEWYDFFLYGVVAGIVFNKLYFPTGDPLVSTMLAYTTFAVGFVTRPLGGLIFGHFGDRIGRKSMLVMTLMIMGVSTFLIGLVPTYDSIGVWAPILLLLLRVFQGIGLGGEWGGAVLMAYEYAPPGKKGFYASLPQIGLAIGLCLASGTVALLSTLLTDEQFMAWGWRVAFLASAAMVLVGMYIRLNIKETPEFTAVKANNAESRIPFFDMLKRYPGNVFKGMGARYIDGVFFNVFGVFSISYLTQTVQITRTEALTGVMAAALVMCFFIPFFGRLSDRIGRTRVYFWGSLITALASFPGFWLMLNSQGSVMLIWLAIIIPFGIFYAAVYGPEAALFCELFDAKVRYTGISFVYQFSGIFASGITPIIATALLKTGGGQPWLICLYVLFAGAVSAWCAWLIGRGKPAEDPVVQSSAPLARPGLRKA